MSFSGKLILCFAVVSCLVQASLARPHMDGTLLENVKYDLLKKSTSLEKDLEKDVMNIKHKIAKDSMKLLKKATKEGAAECVESARLQAEEQLDEKREEIQECIQEVKDSVESGLPPEAGLAEIMAFRTESKNKLQGCKKAGKMDLKAVQNAFSSTGKACLV